MGLTGTKVGCDTGVCGSCTIILNGKIVRPCIRKMRTIDEYSRITTIEGIGTPTNLHPLQVGMMNSGAIQCGFCTPGFVVSAYVLLQQNVDPTREDVRDWFQKNLNVCRCTGYKQIVDGVMDAARVMRGEATIEDITFKYPADGEFYGKDVVRPQALAKVCGLADYGDDLALKMPADTLHVAMVQPKITHHANILRIDTSEAGQMPGVVKIITADDIRAIGGTNGMPETAGLERNLVQFPSRPVLCDSKIFRYGDVVALAVADTKEHARAAAAKVKVDIEQLPEYLSFLDAVAPGAMRIHEDTPNIFAVLPLLKGAGVEDPTKVADIIDNSAYSVEGSFHTTREPHLSIEGDAIQAYFDEDGMLTVHGKSQSLYTSLGLISACTGLPRERIRVIMNYNGASYGWSMNHADYCLAAVATIVTGRPVALSMSYDEHQHFSGKRAPSYSNARAACDENGRITAVEYDLGFDHGPYSDNGDELLVKSSRFAFYAYNVPNAAGLNRVANTNHNFGTTYRSFGSPQANMFGEALVDMLAEQAGIDPFEFRWRNMPRPGDLNINSFPFRRYPFEEMMRRMKPHYERAVADAKAADTPQVRRGVGIAWSIFNVSWNQDFATVDVELNPDGSFTKYDTWQELGQGGDIGSLMVTLEALKPLGPTPDRIRLVQSDSKLCQDSGMSAGSRSHYMNGHATRIAGAKLVEAMRKPDGTFRTYAEMAKAGIPTRYRGRFEAGEGLGLCRLDPNTGMGDPTPAYTYALMLAEVAVDTVSGRTKVDRFHCVADVGKIGNIDAVNGQAYGGISHCIGFALSEDYDDVKKHDNIAASGIPYIKDIPDDITIEYVEETEPTGPWGSSGASEAFQAGGHVAVLNAIYNATGVRIHDLPATRQKVKAGLETLAKGGAVLPPERYFLGSELYDELENIRTNPLPPHPDGFGRSIADPPPGGSAVGR
jgi:aldehyde oxidoreductase